MTAAGPHAGDADTPQLAVDIELLVKIYAGLLYTFLATLAAFGLALQKTDCRHSQVWRRYRIVLAVVTAQGTLGLIQYWTGIRRCWYRCTSSARQAW